MNKAGNSPNEKKNVGFYNTNLFAPNSVCVVWNTCRNCYG